MICRKEAVTKFNCPGYEYRLIQQVGRWFAEQTVFITEELPRDMAAKFLARCRADLRQFAETEAPPQ